MELICVMIMLVSFAIIATVTASLLLPAPPCTPDPFLLTSPADTIVALEKFPEITFKGTKYEKVDGENYTLHGDLTIKDVTKNIGLQVEYGGIQKDPWGNMKAGFTITGKINRKDFGLNWNAALEAGGVMVSEEVRIYCEIQLVKA